MQTVKVVEKVIGSFLGSDIIAKTVYLQDPEVDWNTGATRVPYHIVDGEGKVVMTSANLPLVFTEEQTDGWGPNEVLLNLCLTTLGLEKEPEPIVETPVEEPIETPVEEPVVPEG